MYDAIRPTHAHLRDKIDVVLLDMDGTLLDEEGQLTRRTHAAVQQLRAIGLHVILCTGRSPMGTEDVHADLALETPVVAYNGSWIGHPHAETPERRIVMPRAAVRSLERVESQALFGFRHLDREKWTRATDHAEHDVLVGWYQRVRRAHHVREMPIDDLLRMSLFFDRDQHAAGVPSYERAWSALRPDELDGLRRESFPLDLFPSFRDSRLQFLEIQAASRGKAEALDWIADRYGVPPQRVLAIGDQHNDRPMLKAAGYALAMGNAVPEAKALADRVLASNDEDGIAAWG